MTLNPDAAIRHLPFLKKSCSNDILSFARAEEGEGRGVGSHFSFSKNMLNSNFRDISNLQLDRFLA